MPESFETVCVVGLGYIGLPTASIMATRGFTVHGVDSNPLVVETINQGRVHIHEPDLDALVKSAVASGRLRAHREPQPADVFIIAVPTPFKGDHEPDLAHVEVAARAIASRLRSGNLVILESTSPVGTTEAIGRWVAALRPDLRVPAWRPFSSIAESIEDGSIRLAHCPERVLPGQVLRELVSNDRVIGGIDQSSARHTEAIYRKFVTGKVLLTDARTAEMCKLTENSFRDVNIAFANELSMICDRIGVSVWELIRLANHHPRVKILQPGPGVGGHCIAVDPWFVVHSAPEEARLIRTAREVNNRKPEAVIAKTRALADRFKSPVVACLGLAFKADIDDLRESPSLYITRHLAATGMQVLAVEPHIDTLPEGLKGKTNVELCDLGQAVDRSDIVLLLVDHREFKAFDRARLRDKLVIDTRGIWL